MNKFYEMIIPSNIIFQFKISKSNNIKKILLLYDDIQKIIDDETEIYTLFIKNEKIKFYPILENDINYNNIITNHICYLDITPSELIDTMFIYLLNVVINPISNNEIIKKTEYKNNCIIPNNCNNHKISIIMLVKDNAHYFKDSIPSLLNQTSSDWECIIVNDGSKKIIEYSDFLLTNDCLKFKNHFKIINNIDWLGLIKCHKIGLNHASNQIIGILDVDDKLDNTAVEKILNVYNNSDDNIFVYSNFYYCDENLNILSTGYCCEVENLLNQRTASHFRTFKKKYYFLTSGYDEDLCFGAEDQDILIKMEQYCKPVFLNKTLYYYRTHTLNTTNSISCLKNVALFSYTLTILKNIYYRYNNLKFNIEIYEKEEDKNYNLKYKRYGNYINYENKFYHVELKSNNIFICNLYDDVIDYIKCFTQTKINKFDVNIKWDYKNNKLQIKNGYNFKIKKFSKIHINTYFNKIYIINLKKDINRKKRIESIFNKFNIHCEFVEAVYGKEEPYLSDFINTSLKSEGTYGYSLSMIKIFENAILNKYNKILICDDDIILHKDFINKFDENIKKIPYSWKVLFLGLSGPWSFNVNTFLYNHNYTKNTTSNLVGCDGSFCVGYDRNMFETIINITKEFNKPFDTKLIEYLNNNLHIEKYAFYPQLVIADTLKPSEIVNYQEEMNVMSNFERNHLRFHVNIDDYELNTMENNLYNDFKKNIDKI
jgi:GR25 family glycosyltransferase involved in LPS biosynthesis